MFTKIKLLFMALILAGFTAQYATAESLNQEDMAFAFGDSAVVASDFGQMDLLSSQEMMETEGERFKYFFNWGRNVWKQTNFEGYNGTRIFQVRWKTRPVFRLDYKDNPSQTKLHMNFGNISFHRPWQSPRRTY